MTTKAPAPAKRRVSGFCNPTLPRTPAYDPHTRCAGCDCTCHQEDPVTAEQAPSDQGENHATPQVREASNPLAEWNPLGGLTLEQAVKLVHATAGRLNDAAGGDGITALDWQEAVRLLRTLRASIDTARGIESLLVRHIYLTGEHGDTIVEGIGQVKVTRGRDRKKWDERGVAQAIIDARMEGSDGTPPDPWDVAEWLLEVYGIGYCRVTPLRALGLEPKAFCEEEPGHPQVQLPPTS